MKTTKELCKWYTEWQTAKRQHPGIVVLVRVGDFYEAYGSDARLVAKLLNLTVSGRAISDDARTDMVGLPYHVIEKFITPLMMEFGVRTALCDDLPEVVVSDDVVYYHLPDGKLYRCVPAAPGEGA